MTFELFAVLPDELAATWPFIADRIERACAASGAEMSGVHVHQRIADGEMQCYVIVRGAEIRAVVVTEVNVYPLKKMIRIVLMQGDGMRDWIDTLRDCLQAWQMQIGADGIEAECRPGFARALKATGAKVKRVVMQI